MSKFDLFLSHSWSDKSFVELFKKRVEEKGISCWIDTEQMPLGSSLDTRMKDGVKDSNFFVAFISKPYLQSESCKREFALALDWKKVIIPVRLIDGSEKWPPEEGDVAIGIARKVYLDGTRPINDSELDNMLLNLGLVVDTSSSKKLLDACTFGRITEAFTLLRNGTNPNIVDHENRSPLMLILESKGEFDKNDEDFVQLLIQKIRENGGDLDIEDNTNGTTALIKACAKSRTSAALQLIEAGASLDFVDVGEEDKLTALDYAIGRKLDIVVNAIRKKGGQTFKELDARKGTGYE
jgi:hypothetical protein